MARKGYRVAMGDDTLDSDGRWALQVDHRNVELFRFPIAAHAWRFRSTETLDGNHEAPSGIPVVFP
jgi:hypothetical protein